ncbi:aquaporin [Krasilnikoviella flava]|uniref:Aquaporin Z n=1 Tax=Krasilnikoviella flava TaxID=526729 RepID=A0A1T5JGC8_9MICO|nr:aquaporin [Krasilnikoviella flava]SKC50272.1 aquaporin Z [Krasilnikoviella flava]
MSQDIAAESGTASVDVETAPDNPQYGLFPRLAAEAFGTFVLVLGIVGTATFNAANGGQILPVALAGGILVMGAIAAVGGVSGGHFNPAVTLGITLAGRASWRDLGWYWVAQLVGGVAAAAVLFSLIPAGYAALVSAEDKAGVFAGTANGFGSHSPLSAVTGGQAEFSQWSALLVEVVVTAVFVGVILAVTSKRSKVTFAPAVIGLALGALIIVAWPVTNASLNPARSFASAVFAGGWTWGQLWLFIVGPLVGAALAALFYRAFAPVPAAVRVEVGTAAGDDLGDGLVDEPRQHDVVDDGALAEADAVDDASTTTTSGTDDEPKGDAPRV